MQSQLIEFIKKYPLAHFEKGQTILHAGDSTETLYAIQTGFVKVTSIDDTGTEQLLWIAGRYDAIPTEQLFTLHGHLQCHYLAMGEVSVYSIDKQAFLKFASENVGLQSEISRSMSFHYDDLLYRLRSVEQTSARDKIIHTLYNLATRLSADETVNFYELGLELTHQDISDMVGLTRETTSLELSKLKRQRHISYNRRAFKVHTGKLEALIEN